MWQHWLMLLFFLGVLELAALAGLAISPLTHVVRALARHPVGAAAVYATWSWLSYHWFAYRWLSAPPGLTWRDAVAVGVGVVVAGVEFSLARGGA